ncbi:hypothetical protein [Mangrovimonas aestuarii]|uniref:hypothetical protein n=1 Tax=Mangrovimonas aestuarii TaxID=3018443 RepID=UPI0023785BC6|nr:hypothetical protein [Mangrovimonas aestuarii]
MKQQITEDRIAQLYEFTKKHFVDHYDIQTELVDHLANGIETQWEEHPNRNFEEALQIEFKKFGVFGFQDVVEQRMSALTKHYWKEVWQLFKQYFKLPRIIMTVALMIIVYCLMNYFLFNEYVVYGYFGFVLTLFVAQTFRLRRKSNKRYKQDGKHWLFEDVINTLGQTSFIAQLPMQIMLYTNMFLEKNMESVVATLILTVFMVLYGLLAYLIAFYIPKHMEEKLQAMYPEYKMV